MQYPLISEYVRAIQDASNNLDKLAHLVPVLDDHGEPYRSSGAFAVVFKMKDEQTGKCYALKCFTEEQEGRAEAYRLIADELEFVDSSYITSVKYLDKEIFVDSSCEEDEFPVLLMDWIDGETMETYIAENYLDNYAMAMLCYRFCKMAAWLRSQPFAHGDIKPDNIMVRPDGNLTLVDYDGMFVPAMKGQKSPTIGTKDFSHPLRTVDDFDETIDDFALASIALSLKAISLKPSLLDEYGAADRLLFSAKDYRDLSKSKVLAALQELMNVEEVNTLLSMFLLVCVKKNIVTNQSFLLDKPLRQNQELATHITEELLRNTVSDEFGVLYSKNGRFLISARGLTEREYTVKNNTEIICDQAFYNCRKLIKIKLAKSIKQIGKFAFFHCSSLKICSLPDNVENIGEEAFFDCRSLEEMVIPSRVQVLSRGLFFQCTSLSKISISQNVSKIEGGVFSVCFALRELKLPTKLKFLGEGFVSGSYKLEKLVVPSSVEILDGNPFAEWRGHLEMLSLNYVYEDDVLYDKSKKHLIAFRKDADTFEVPFGVRRIGKNSFWANRNLCHAILPSTIEKIERFAFGCCEKLKTIKVPITLNKVDDGVFYKCDSLDDSIKKELVERFGKQIFKY